MKPLLLTLSLFVILSSAVSKADDETPMSSRNACQSTESWSYGELSKQWREEFIPFLAKKNSPVRGFSHAMALRRLYPEMGQQRLFAEYWISRSLFEAKLPHIALGGFNTIINYPPTAATAGIQFAALQCISELLDANPSFQLPQKSWSQLQTLNSYAKTEYQNETLWLLTGKLLRQQIAENAPHSDIQKTMALLKGAGAHEILAKGWYYSYLQKHHDAIAELTAFLAAPPNGLARFKDAAHLLLGRAYYTTKQFEKSSDELKRITKSSNQMAITLSDLSWAYLQDEKFREAIGTALSLQTGSFRNTFSPEAIMVMAMAYNELCHYPQSLSAISTFAKNYEKPYRWLDHYIKDTQTVAPHGLYSLAIQFLKKQGDTPVRVASEWVRSPLFLSHQSEINLLYDEKDSAVKLGKLGATEQQTAALELIELWKEVRGRVRSARANLKFGEELSGSAKRDLDAVQKSHNHFKRFVQAAPAWRAILANHEKKAPVIQKQLVDSINRDLAARTKKMYSQLQEVAENNQLIEVEIYNGASQDIIWQNAHPDYKELAKKIEDQNPEKDSKKVWDWGRSVANTEEGTEVWEDELGSFRADLIDNCSSKDKYMALKARNIK